MRKQGELIHAHPLRSATLQFYHNFGLGVMNPLPLEDLHEIPHGFSIFGTFKHLRPSHWTDPKPSFRIPSEPLACRARFRVGCLI